MNKTEAAWRKAIADQVRANCTPDWETVKKGGDTLIQAVCDWIENPPEWTKLPGDEIILGEAWRNKKTGTIYAAVFEPFPGSSVWMVTTEAGSQFNVRRRNLERLNEKGKPHV